MLIETVPRGAGRVAVIGIGINLLEQRVADAPRPASPGSARSTRAAARARRRCSSGCVPALAAALRRFERDGFAAFAAAFAGRDLLRGRAVRWAAGDGPGREGIASGVSAGGELLLRTPAGIEPIGSGEVSVRLEPAPAAGDPQRSASDAMLRACCWRCWSPTCSSSASPAAGSTACSACSRAAIASPSGSPTRCARRASS